MCKSHVNTAGIVLPLSEFNMKFTLSFPSFDFVLNVGISCEASYITPFTLTVKKIVIFL
jgi:hypothetical protein